MSDVEFPQNDFTRMIERVSDGNRSGFREPGVASATPAPTVRSADYGREVVPAAAPLTSDERANLDLLAAQAGIKDERLSGTVATEGAYESLDAAIAAGEPVERHVGARELITSTRRSHAVLAPQPFRLPDFGKIEGIDLVSNRVLIDGLEFPLDDENAADFRNFVVEHVRGIITEKLNEAIGLALPVTAEGKDGGSGATESGESVQRESTGGSTKPPM